MAEVNAFTIQEKLRKMQYISVPWIQEEYGFTYSEAREFRDCLMKRGWIEKTAEGVHYKVIGRNLCLRKLDRIEIDGLIENIDLDCVMALTCIQDKAGAKYGEIAGAIRDSDDTDSTLKVLLDHDLICQVGDIYVAKVSRKTTEVLNSVIRRKRQNDMRRSLSNKADDARSLRRLFDVLFDD